MNGGPKARDTVTRRAGLLQRVSIARARIVTLATFCAEAL